MFGLFGKNKKVTKASGDKAQPTSSKEVREQALAQFRKTHEELGEETIQAMKRAIEMERAKKEIRDSIDGKGKHSRDEVYQGLRELIDESERR
tara:strand:+ start:487 stop:765 length:279 start_codon:yes stop_codon:yes gene_type:complete